MPTSEIIKLNNVRLSFPRLWTPKKFREKQEPRFEATFILDPSDELHAEMIQELWDTAAVLVEEQWGEDPKGLVYCFGDADEDEIEYDGFQGMFYVRSASPKNSPPVVTDRGRRRLEKNEDGLEPRIPYAGSYVNTVVTLWSMDNEFGNRINCNLRIVQFVRDGEAFGAREADPEDELEELPEEDSSEEEGTWDR